MYKLSTTLKSASLAIAASTALLFAATAVAGPDKGKSKGKPGMNTILEGGTIAEIAATVNDGGDGEFNNLLAVVGCFGPVTLEPGDNPIIDLLNGSDTYTLFAPTDAAFDALLGRLEPLFPGVSVDPCILDNNDDLSLNTLFTVLAYHVTDGRRFSNSVFNSNNVKMIPTLAGLDITSFVTTDDVPVLQDVDNQEVFVVAPLFNINAVNGVIHVVDKVLLPIDLPEPVED